MNRIFASASLLALTFAIPAMAQTTAASNTSNANPPASDQVVVTASRSGDPQRLDLIGASATVIGDQDLDDRQVRVVSDVLRDVPGIAVSRGGAIGALTQVRIRGAEGNQTLVFIDGIKASDPYDGEYDFGTLIADEDARIEVIRGQQSSLYGSDAIGGVINYTTLSGREAPGVKLQLEGGSFGTYDGMVRAAGVVNDLDYALSASYLHTDGYPVAPGGSRDVGSDNLGASAKLIWSPLSNIHLTAVARYSRTDAESDDSNADTTSPTFGQTVDSPGVHFVNTGYYGLVRGEFDLLNDHWTNALTAQIADTTRTGYDVADPYSPPAGQPIVESSGDHGRRLRGSFESTYRFGDDKVKQSVTFALDGERESERTTTSPFGAYLGWRDTNNIGVVGEYDLTVNDRFSFGASIRNDDNDRFADSDTYRVQASYTFDEGTRVHAAAGSGVKAPSFSELYDYYAGRYIGNPNLKPEKSEGFEAGVEQSLLKGRVMLDLTYFNNHLKDEITTDYSTGVATPVNLSGRNLLEGVELTAVARISRDWRLDAAYTYLNAPQSQFVIAGGAFTTVTGEAVRRARDIASVNLTWAPAGRPYSATLTLRYNGKQYDVAYIDPSFVPLLENLRAFTLVNLNASYKLSQHLEVYGRIENLFDQDYQEVYSFRAPGRTAYAGLRYRF